MKVFISWSGDRAKAVAGALRDWLPLVLQSAKPWVSSHDIAAGKRWSVEIANELEAAEVGVLCLTPENRSAPWLLFEAGALSKAVGTSKVVPYLFDLPGRDMTDPLAQFNYVSADLDGTTKLVASINAVAGAGAVPDEALRAIVEALWPRLEGRLKAVPPLKKAVPASRSDGEVLNEILEHVRRLAARGQREGNPDVRWQKAAVRSEARSLAVDVGDRGATPEEIDKISEFAMNVTRASWDEAIDIVGVDLVGIRDVIAAFRREVRGRPPQPPSAEATDAAKHLVSAVVALTKAVRSPE